MTVYAIRVDDQNEVDQIVETKEIANREARDLRKMGFEVKVRSFPSWEAAEAWDQKLRGM